MHPLWATTLKNFLILPFPSSLSSRLVHLAAPCTRAIPDTWLAPTLPQNLCSTKIPFWSWRDQKDIVLEMRVNHKFIHDDSPYPFPNNFWLPTFFFWQYVIPISFHCSKDQPRASHFMHDIEAVPLSIHHFALPYTEPYRSFHYAVNITGTLIALNSFVTEANLPTSWPFPCQVSQGYTEQHRSCCRSLRHPSRANF